MNDTFMKEKPVLPLILSMTLPMVLSMLVNSLYNSENGVGNGDTTRRTDVYFNLYRKMPKQDRLAAGYTLDKYERMYTGVLYAAAKAADPDWEIGKAIKPGALDGVTRESAEAGNSLSGSSIDTTV